MERITIQNIHKSFEGKGALEAVSLTIEAGSFFTLLGPSGCGKTTLLRILAGFEKADEGVIKFGEQDVTNIPAEQRGVGMVFQNYALFPHMSVYENVAYGLKVKKYPRRELKEKVAKYLRLVRLEGYEERAVSALSGGEQQRVALARSLATEPKVLLLDEPLCNLDAKLRDEMREEIKALQKQLQITTLFVTHDQKEALMMSDQVAVFNHGKCIQVGTPEALYNQPKDTFVATFVGEINLLSEVLLKQLARENMWQPLANKCYGIRPEGIRLYTATPEGINTLKGTLKSVQFNGQVSEYTVEIAGVPLKCVQINTGDTLGNNRVGQEVWLELPTHAIKVLEG